MSDQELFYLLALLRVEGVGDVMAKKLLGNFENAEAVFNAKSTQIAAIGGVGSALIKNLKNKTIFESANRELEFIKSNEI